ncbi:putative F-box protein PP2-B12 [Miscanthus floridulus]|uniref:putative F-box protein PP2-B12 n=1 Tax=Miscanthus floridulus TaxID=154761 RepID=UPI003459F831
MESTATAPATCEIARLPDDLLSASLARTGPLDACRAALVSPAFRSAADADAVWSSLLPRDLPQLADGELPADPQPTKKQLFMRLSDSARPVLLADGLTSMWLDRATAAKCYMLSARKLGIIWGDTPRYWRWIPLTDSRFPEGAELLDVCWLEIRGKIHCNMLSQNTTYATYMVFKMSDESYGLDYPLQLAEVSIGATKSTRQVCLGYDNEGEDGEEVPQNYRSFRPIGLFRPRVGRRNRRVPPGVQVQHPQTRADGCKEMEMGEFKNEEGEDGEVSISLMETRGGNWKKGLIVQGIEIRVKK